MHRELSGFDPLRAAVFHRHHAAARDDEPRVRRLGVHVHGLLLTRRNRDDDGTELIADVHPSGTLLLFADDDVIGDRNDALVRVGFRPVGVSAP